MTQQRRRWTYEEVARLLGMAQKYPPAEIASEIGRPLASVRTKALREVFFPGGFKIGPRLVEALCRAFGVPAMVDGG